MEKEMKVNTSISLFNNLMRYADTIQDVQSESMKRFVPVAVDGHSLLKEMLDMQDGLVIGMQPADENGLTNPMAADDQDVAVNGLALLTCKTELLDITGTPLECPFDMNDVTAMSDTTLVSNSSASYGDSLNSLPIKEACGFMNVVRDFLEDQEYDSANHIPIVLQCDGVDHSGTILMGHQKEAVGGLKRFRVKCKDALVDAEKLDKFEDVKREHMWGMKSFLETEARAVYSIVDRSEDAPITSSTSIKLICNWTNVKQVLETPNPDAICTIIFDVSMGDVRSQAHDKFLELSDLEGLANGLRTDEITWAALNSRSERPVDVSLAKLLDSSQIGGSKPATMKPFSETIKPKSTVDDAEQRSFSMTRTRNVDFTDKLWTILKDCGSYDDLVKSVNVVLDTVKSGVIKPVIFTSNHTSFAEIVADIVHRKESSIHRLSLMNPLLALVEMGIEKLKQDYACILLGSNLMTRDSLNSLFAHNKRNISSKNKTNKRVDKGEEWEHNLLALRKLHCVVELVALCQVYVDDSHTLLGNYARSALDKLVSIQNMDQSHSFTFGISRQATKKIFESVFPLVWQMRLSSKDNWSFVRTAYRLSVSHPLDLCSLKHLNCPAQQDDDRKAGPFHVCVATLVHGSI